MKRWEKLYVVLHSGGFDENHKIAVILLVFHSLYFAYSVDSLSSCLSVLSLTIGCHRRCTIHVIQWAEYLYYVYAYKNIEHFRIVFGRERAPGERTFLSTHITHTNTI